MGIRTTVWCLERSMFLNQDGNQGATEIRVGTLFRDESHLDNEVFLPHSSSPPKSSEVPIAPFFSLLLGDLTTQRWGDGCELARSLHPSTSTLCSIPARSLLHWLFSSFRCRLSSASLPLTPATSRRLRCSSAMVRSLAPAALANSSPRRVAFCWLEAASSWAPRSCSFRGSSSASEERKRWRSGLPVSHCEPGRY